MYNFADEVHHPRNNVLRPNWSVLLAALMNNFADRTILACTAVALMDNLADESTIYATLGCGLNWRILHVALTDMSANKPHGHCALLAVVGPAVGGYTSQLMTVAIPAVGWLFQPCVAIPAACGYTSQLVTLAIPAVGGYSSRAWLFQPLGGYSSRGWLYQPIGEHSAQ